MGKIIEVINNELIIWRGDGAIQKFKAIGQIKSMISPVVCSHCGKVYDLASGKVEVRFTDCTQFKTPCCNTTADDRTWKSLPDFKRLEDI